MHRRADRAVDSRGPRGRSRYMAVVMAVWKNMGRIRRRSMEGMGGGLLSFFVFLGGVYCEGLGIRLLIFCAGC